MKLPQLDLHGLRHHEVRNKVEEFIIREDMPVLIITGYSSAMQQIVKDVIEHHKLSWQYESCVNLGSMLITDRI